MNDVLFAIFPVRERADAAVHALMQRGFKAADISLVANETHVAAMDAAAVGASRTETEAAAMGAGRGFGAGAVLGVIGVISAVIIPGYGIVLGAGALATALTALIETAAAGAFVGATVGVMQEHGVPRIDAEQYDEALRQGSVLLSLALPAGGAGRTAAEEIVVTHGALDVRSYPGRSV